MDGERRVTLFAWRDGGADRVRNARKPAGSGAAGLPDLNTGAAANLRLKLFDFNQRLSLALEADGGVKYNYDVHEANGGFKGIFEGGVILEGRLPGGL